MSQDIRLSAMPGLLVEATRDYYKEKNPVSSFLRSIFRSKETVGSIVSVETVRKNTTVAIDRIPGSGANTNRFDRSTVKKYKTALYDEEFNITELDAYTRIAGAADTITTEAMDELIEETVERVDDLREKIGRSIEAQCAEALFERKITLKSAKSIDYAAKAESSIDAGPNGGIWSDLANSDPVEAILKGCNFIRTEGKADVAKFNLMARGDEIEKLKNNAKIQARADLRNMKLVDITFPVWMETTGAAYHGQLVAGSYIIDLWAYDQSYVSGGSDVYYCPLGKAALFPTGAEFFTRYGGVPRYDERTGLMIPRKGQFHVQLVTDQNLKTSNFQVASRCLAVPYAIDKIAVINTEANP